MARGGCDPANVIQIQAGGEIDHFLGSPVSAMDQNAAEIGRAFRPARFR